MSKMNDTIYRQAAIDALGDKPLAWTEGEYELGLQNQWQSDVDALKALPSADPGLDEWCIDCKEYDQKRHCCPRFNRVIRETIYEMKQNTGHWQKDPDRDGYGRYICSECKEPFEVEERMGKPLWKFCPMCGARMEAQNE